MRLHREQAREERRQGDLTLTSIIAGASPRRAPQRTSALSADFTPEGAQAFFDYHQQQKEQEHERSADRLKQQNEQSGSPQQLGSPDMMET